MSAASRNWLTGVIAAVAIAGFAYLIWWDLAHPEVTFWKAFLVAQIPSALALGAIAFRTSYLSGGLVPIGTALRGNSLALSGTLVLPAGLSEFGKRLHFRAICGYPVPKGLKLVIEERIWDAVSLGLVILVTLVLAGGRAESATLNNALWITSAVGIAGLALLLGMPGLARRIPLLARLDERHAIFRPRPWSMLVGSLGLSVLIWALSVLLMAVTYHFSGLPALDLNQILILFTVATLGLAVSITPGSLGTFEGSVVGVLALYGVPWDAALAFAIGFRISWMCVPVAVGLAALRIDGAALARAARPGSEAEA